MMSDFLKMVFKDVEITTESSERWKLSDDVTHMELQYTGGKIIDGGWQSVTINGRTYSRYVDMINHPDGSKTFVEKTNDM